MRNFGLLSGLGLEYMCMGLLRYEHSGFILVFRSVGMNS